MKLLVLILTLTLLFTADRARSALIRGEARRPRVSLEKLHCSGGALDCHRCVPKRAGGTCQLTVETCKPNKDACVAAKFLREPFGRFQRCIALSDCKMLEMNAYINIKCCTEDMCNTFIPN